MAVDNRYSVGSEQHGVSPRRSFQPRPRRFRPLFEVRDRDAFAQMIAEPGAVAGRRWEIDFEEQVQGAGQRVLPAREARRRAQPGSLEQAGEQLSRLEPSSAWYRLMRAVASQNRSSFSICRPSRVCAGVGLSPPRISLSYFLASSTLAR